MINDNEYERLDLFAYPILKKRVPYYDLTNYVMDMIPNDKGEFRSNRGGWQSTHFYSPEPEFQELWELIEREANVLHQSIKLKGRIKLVEWWFNVNWKGGSNRLHNHPQSMYSGVYYIKTPPDCGNINFPNPNMTEIDFFWPIKMREESTRMVTSCATLGSAKDMLYIFPSWLSHYVDTNMSDEPRISLSFNSHHTEYTY